MKKRVLLIAIVIIVAGVVLFFAFDKKYPPRDWRNYNVLEADLIRPDRPTYQGKQISYQEYVEWIKWGEEWFRGETFGNEKVWTDVVGLLNGTVDVPDGSGWRSEPFFKFLLKAIDDLDGVRGNLYSGNGEGYTHDLVVTFPAGALLDKTFAIPEKLHTGLDVEAGSVWPLGVVPFRAPKEDEALPYLLDPSAYSSGPDGIGPLPGGGKYRVGLSCALCHYSLDIDWDGKTDLKWAQPDRLTEGSPYRPEHAWAIGNQDIHLGWVFALSKNTIAGFETSAPIGGASPGDARKWANWVHDNYENNAIETKREVDRGLLAFPRGFADDTPDGLHNPLQFPSLFTHLNWPFNYDAVLINASDRNNNVWTVGLDLTQLVALCNDRGGATAKLAFWQEKGFYSDLSAEQYADILVLHSPAVQHDSSLRQKLRDDILGASDGVPGLLRNDSVALIKAVPGALPSEILNHPDNQRFNRLREPEQFRPDGKERDALVGMLGTRVITPPNIRNDYKVADLERKYGLNGDEFVTDAVSLMLDWVEPPPNLSPLLANARQAGLVQEGYELFKSLGCSDCHAGPILTDNLIVPLKEIGTNPARSDATKLIQTLLAPEYDPATGLAVSGGIIGAIRAFVGGKRAGYKTVTLRYLYGSAPYLHDGGVAVALKPDAASPGDDLEALLKRPENDKIYGVGQILAEREMNPSSYLRANASLSLQALLLKSERDRVISANKEQVYPAPGGSEKVALASMQIEGAGHTYWVDDQVGGRKVAALVAFLLALDDDPSR